MKDSHASLIVCAIFRSHIDWFSISFLTVLSTRKLLFSYQFISMSRLLKVVEHSDRLKFDNFFYKRRLYSIRKDIDVLSSGSALSKNSLFYCTSLELFSIFRESFECRFTVRVAEKHQIPRCFCSSKARRN